MNINSLMSKIRLFDELVINSGKQRDIVDFYNSIQNTENRNLIFMKDISARVQDYFSGFENYRLGEELNHVLRNTEAFTNLSIGEKLAELDSNSNFTAEEYYSHLSKMLSELTTRIDQNEAELDELGLVFEKYVESDIEEKQDEAGALMSIIFRDVKSTSSVKELSKVLHSWNQTLLIYHSLVTSESPTEIKLIEVQNGSIDIIVSLDFEVAINLVELITLGFKVYAAYLFYKSDVAKKIIESYSGSKELLDLETKRESLMLENIKESVNRKIQEQHIERLKVDKNIDKTSLDKKIDTVSSVVIDHIAKGNEVKLLEYSTQEEEADKEQNASNELKFAISEVREGYKELPDEERIKLLEKYSIDLEDLDKNDKS